MSIEATVGDASARLGIGGDCPMAALPQLERQLRRIRGANPAALDIDLTRAGEFDLGPAWLLHGALTELRARGVRVEVTGDIPLHFAYLDKLAATDAGTFPTPPPGGVARWLADYGRSLEVRAASWYEALSFGGKLLVTAGARWSRLQGLRLPSVTRHVYETGVRALPTLLYSLVFADNGLASIVVRLARLHRLELDVAELEQRNERLRPEIARREKDPEAIARLARERYGMAYPGEKIYPIVEVSPSEARRLERERHRLEETAREAAEKDAEMPPSSDVTRLH